MEASGPSICMDFGTPIQAPSYGEGVACAMAGRASLLDEEPIRVCPELSHTTD
jgi:hypothetical protein